MEATWDMLMPIVSPSVKLEASPTDSMLSEPTGTYPSLFSGSTVASSAAPTPTDTGSASMSIIFADGEGVSQDTSATTADMSPAIPLSKPSASQPAAPSGDTGDASEHAPAPAPTDKKPAKKRKSWGQVLPEPKTNLPPRKRAKTEDEKEQRRVERVLRNRRAAQSSRERKRLEVEALEKRNHDLEEELLRARRENMILYQQLAQAQGKSGVAPSGNGPVTFSQELFSSQPPSTLESLLTSRSAATINPVSLSPALQPVPDHADQVTPSLDDGKTAAGQPAGSEDHQSKSHPQSPKQHSSQQPGPTVPHGASTSATSTLELSPDTTQRPAATLCPDLQCLSAEESQVDFSMLPSVDSDSYFLESGYLDSPNSGNSDFNYLVDNDTAAPVLNPDFNINEFFDADGPNQSDGGDLDSNDVSQPTLVPTHHHSPSQDASENPDQQPHTGASLGGCDDAGNAVGVF